jgi:integrase
VTEKSLKIDDQKSIVRENVYDVKGKIESVKRRINASDQISERNRQLIYDFCDHCRLQGLSNLRILFYLNRFWNIARYTTKPLDRMERRDIEAVVARVQNSCFSPRTVADHLTVIKTFWKWLEGKGEVYPEKVAWIKPRYNNRKAKLPEELLTKDDVDMLVDAAVSVRDKALISMLYDSGCRIGELLTLKIKHVRFDSNGAVVMVDGKTGQRRVRIIHSTPRLLNWIDHHPARTDPEAFLFVSIGSRNHCKQLRYESVSKMLRETAERAGISKRVNPHLFRHSRATFLAKHLTEAQMKEYFGWTQASEMAAVYVHLSGRDVDGALLKLAGKEVPESEKEIEMDRRVRQCSICRHENPPEVHRCAHCARPLDLKTALEDDTRERELLRILTPEILEEMIQKRVQELSMKKPEPRKP